MSTALLLDREPGATALKRSVPDLGAIRAERNVSPASPACLPLYRGEEVVGYALVDRPLLAQLQRLRWSLDARGHAYTNTGDGRIALHRYVMGVRPGEPFEVHHLNTQQLDCRRANLEVLTGADHDIAHGKRPRADRQGDATHPAHARGLDRWLADLRDGGGAEGIGDLIMALRGSGRPKKLPQVLSQEEVAALMGMPNLRVPTGLRDRSMMMLMHRCGLRVSEACGLHLRDVKWKDKQIHLRPEITKGGVEAVVYMDTATSSMLERWVTARREHAAGQPWLFCTLSGGPVNRRAVYGMVVRRARKAGIEKPIGPHTLRHTYATELLREGFNLREVQHLMRHADIRTTVIYTHLFEADLAAKIASR